MRSPAIVSLLLFCGWANTADARLFWQTYGSTVPTADGCQRNTNSDYFVPRHCDSCRYGLYSPCKRACTTSPACRRCHALYPGYCSPYGCFHYCRLNHIYARKCGCSPVAYRGPYRPGCGPHLCQRHDCGMGCHQGNMCLADSLCSEDMCPYAGCVANDDCMYLPNVESSEFQILGSISLSGDPLLTSLQLGGAAAGMQPLPGAMTPSQLPPNTMPTPPNIPRVLFDPQSIPVFPNPELEHSPQPLASPSLQ